ncbi:MAG TPA: hypothetical protein VEQ84_20145 [Vicinamibacteria bacterium]|nr:hypothetical protein [Vicinamibacteria bacterium]
MRINAIRTIGGAIILTVTAMTLPALAQNVYAYLYDPARVTNDDQLFLNLAVRDAGLTRAALDPVLPRVRSLDSDLPVILFIARQTGRPVDAVVDLRARGASWAQVFSQLGIRYDTLFAGIDRDPGPYYRSSWSYWTAHRDRPQFTDVQVRELARLQLAQRIAGVPVFEVARVRNPVVFVAQRRGRPWVRAAGVPPGHGGVPPGHGGIPPGQVKDGVPPGHREAVRVEDHGKVKIKEKGHDHADGDDDHGDRGDKGKGKAKGKGHGKH